MSRGLAAGIVDQAADGSECTTERLVSLEQTESDLAEIAAIRATAGQRVNPICC